MSARESTATRPCAVVTGGRRGIGAAIVERLRGDGLNVVGLSSSECDVRDAGSVDAAFTRIEEEHGPILVLVNNAGITRDGLALRMSDDDWDAVLQTNLTGAFHCTRRVLSPMMRRRFGRIVNVSSVVGTRIGNPGQANYAASKAGLVGFTKTIAREMARKGITCNAVTPGFIATDMTKDVDEGLLSAIPAGRVGTPEEVASAVSFLASEEAGYVNGATLTVDGAMSA
ncbi:beta-ketoacyl-ACP reductase [Capillimicrobium parvum]|uniref:3-oxoacyl-[acyl-carrier-protein] reductase FabG n=1 Tax=Capillimicrobium parvum TaxID=2884022 RepID=A0A9E6XYX3_9ACTN|nr:beta-ketoacyl-ACP reductase [Capillimicrobium parvum]UGS36866.1 3-oxoacyl-[acyl-carrier-protein] reductase FabG [Capillimicrobium parvum]